MHFPTTDIYGRKVE